MIHRQKLETTWKWTGGNKFRN